MTIPYDELCLPPNFGVSNDTLAPSLDELDAKLSVELYGAQ